MKVKDLKKLLETLSDEVDVVVEGRGGDHEYFSAESVMRKAHKTSYGLFEPYYGCDNVIDVLLVQ